MNRPAIAHGEDIKGSDLPDSIAAALARSVEVFAGGSFIHWHTDGELLRQSYADTWQRARRILGGLQREGVRSGDKLLLYFRECRNFVPAIWAALLAGAIPTPVARNEWSRYHAHAAPALFERLRTILDSPRAVTDGPETKVDRALGLDPKSTFAIATLEVEPPADVFHSGALDDLALLVLSSGTTGQPNLVSLTARAVLHRWWPVMPAGEHAVTFLSCWPFDHIMGMSTASPNLPMKVHLATDRFVHSPTLWLDAVERFGITHATMTNFGMSLIARQVAASPGLRWDLTSLRKIGVGGEAVDPEVCRRFCKGLRPFGLREDAIILGYGLSECGPVVGGSRHFQFDGGGGPDPVVILDRPTRGHSVRVVGEGGEIVQEGEIGELHVRGPSMALGYYGDPQGSALLFTSDGWLRTGDLGVLRNGELAITGREKETIVFNAKKYSCFEIETIARALPEVESAFAATCRAIHADEAGERSAPFALFFVAPSLAPARRVALATRLRRAISGHFGFAPAYLVAIDEHAVSRTPLGKVQRLRMAERLDAGEFDGMVVNPDAASEVPARNMRLGRVAAIFTRLLGFDDFGVDDDFFDLGGDSLAATKLVFELEAAFARSVPGTLIHERTSVRRLAAFFAGGSSEAPGHA